jgi:hypothetical protein
MVGLCRASPLAVACCPLVLCTGGPCALLLPGLGGSWRRGLPGASVARLSTAPFFLSLFRWFVPLLRISVWCLCGWPLGALLVLHCAVCGCLLFSVQAGLCSCVASAAFAAFCVGLFCWVGSVPCMCLLVSCFLSPPFLRFPFASLCNTQHLFQILHECACCTFTRHRCTSAAGPSPAHFVLSLSTNTCSLNSTIYVIAGSTSCGMINSSSHIVQCMQVDRGGRQSDRVAVEHDRRIASRDVQWTREAADYAV